MKYFLKKIITPFTAILLVITFICAPITNTLHIKVANAQWAVFDAANYQVNYQTYLSTVSIAQTNAVSAKANVISAEADASLETKEFVLDAIVWALINLMIEQLIKSVTQWVASGFQGSPAFVTDLQGFVMDLADKVAGDFIYGSSLSALCSPFKLNIQFALDMQYSESSTYKAKCTLSSVMSNATNFMEGDFLSGGWDEWFSMTQNPHNNQYGAMAEAQAGMTATIQNAKGEEIKLLDFGKGLMSLKDANGKVITPGTSIESTLNESLNTPGKRLTVADEIDELLGQLIATLVSTVLSSATGGLAGLSSTGQNSTYFTSTAAQATAQGSTAGASTLFDTDIQAITEYIGYQNTIVSIITAAETFAQNSCLATGLDALLTSQRASASSAITSVTTILNTINQYKSDYIALGSSPTDALLAKYNATDVATAQANLVSQYQSYVSSAGVPSISTNANLQVSVIPAIQNEITVFETAINTTCASMMTP